MGEEGEDEGKDEDEINVEMRVPRLRARTWLARATGRGAVAARWEEAARWRRVVRTSRSSSCTLAWGPCARRPWMAFSLAARAQKARECSRSV